MVIRGNSRGNARQLGAYLLAQKDNEHIRILDVDGLDNARAEDLHRTLFGMGITCELTKGEKGLYHAQVNPAIGEDAGMTDERWMEAGDILARQLGLENQRRVMVLHAKKGRTHAHVVWERYDHEKKKLVSDSFSRLAQDRARKEMEISFGHNRTPHRNQHRPELKASLSQLWHSTGSGAQFVTAAKNNGYIIAQGSGRSPYIVVDAAGRSYDLARQLQGVRLKEVRQRLRGESLMGEKDAIIYARKLFGENAESVTSKQKTSSTPKPKPMSQEFKDNASDIGSKQQTKQDAPQPESSGAQKQAQFTDNKQSLTGQQPEQTLKQKFAENKADISGQEKVSDKEKRRQEIMQRLDNIDAQNQKQKDKDRGPDIG